VLVPGAAVLLLACAGTPESGAPADVTAGRVLFEQYCASCHGVSGEGNGPVASALEKPPADLTRLTEEFGRPLQEARLVEFIDGRTMVVAHGRADMPVWGKRLYGDVPPHGMTEANRRNTIRLIVDFLDSIQRAD